MTDGSLVSVQIVDTSGQERFRSLNERYFKKADCCLLVYDITDEKTFKECQFYSKEIKNRCKKDIKVVLLGNKTDLKNERKISSEKGAHFASENGYIFMETSCLKNSNVATAFQTLIEITHREYQKNNAIKRINSRIILDSKTHKKKDKDKKKKKCRNN